MPPRLAVQVGQHSTMPSLIPSAFCPLPSCSNLSLMEPKQTLAGQGTRFPRLRTGQRS